MLSTKTSVEVKEILSDQAARRLDHFLVSHFKNIPKSRVYRLLRRGEVRVNGKRAKPDYRLKVGDKVRIPPVRLPEETPERIFTIPVWQTELIEESMVYEDADILVINKPAGISVHAGTDVSAGVIEILRQLRKEEPGLELAHRLDRDTSGCLIIAKRNDALRALHELFRIGQVTKIYSALTMGHWAHKDTRVDLPLYKGLERSGERMVVTALNGKPAVTEFHVKRVYSEATLVQAVLETGRTHQIRVHAAAMHHPIAGDPKYGDREFNKAMHEYGLRRLFLHCEQMSFIWPHSGKKISIEVPIGDELQLVLSKM